MCDVAYSCLHYLVDISLEDVQESRGLELTGILEGVPSLADYLDFYCSAAGKPWPVAQWKFYIAFSLFRGASIYAGVHCRWIMGNASGGHRARHAGKKADVMIEIAWAFVQRESVLHEHPPSNSIAQEHMQQLGKEIRDHTPSTGGKLVPNQKVKDLRNRLIKFMEDHIYPVENEFYELAQSTKR